MPLPLLVGIDQSGEPGGSRKNELITVNNAVADVNNIASLFYSSMVVSWHTAAANSGQALGRGSTDTAVATGAFSFSTFGVITAKAAVTTGQALTAQTVPASLWALYALDIASGGTITTTPAALNTTGYATEALAIAALPARLTAQARLGYLTVLASASTWIGATDALAGGATGNPATTTNYYPYDGIAAPTGVSTISDMTPYTGGRNGIVVATVLARGSTDTNVSSTAFTYNARGIADIAKAAVTVGTALGALGTIPADQWGLIVAYINSVGTITFTSAPLNYSSGYPNESAAIAALSQAPQTANLARMGYFTVKTASGLAWIAGTDALAGGTTGNEASITNYYPQAGMTTPGAGQTAAQIANMSNQVITS